MHRRSILFCALILVYFSVFSQEASKLRAPDQKRFIDRVEFVFGPSLSFNHGNRFVDNYKDDVMENKRLTSIGYSVGLGAYHPINNWLGINARIIWEQKGSRAELNVPLAPVNNDARLIIESKYSYKYLTIAVLPQVYIGLKKRFTLSVGGYYSFINDVEGSEKVLTTDDNVTLESHFKGRSLRGFRDDGSVNSIAFIPGIQSFEDHDYGITFGFGYLVKIKNNSSIMFQLIDNFGLRNINRPVDALLNNPPEKNHTVSVIIGYLYMRPGKK